MVLFMLVKHVLTSKANLPILFKWLVLCRWPGYWHGWHFPMGYKVANFLVATRNN